MKLTLTEGMAGEKIQDIVAETDSVKEVLEHIFAWKNDLENQKAFKIEPYDKLTFDTENHRIIIDFGSWTTFMLVSDVSDEQMQQFTSL